MKKRILILCDGTWNDLEMRYITNVGRLAQILEPKGLSGSHTIPQLIYYDDGVAAHDGGLERLWNGAFGGGLERNIYEAYRFLAFNYAAGDEVCLFGFSRGAYTVRSLAGMIARVGLAPRRNMKHIPDALAAYRGGKKGWAAFRQRSGSATIPIRLLGCWDTVGALGVPDKIPWLSIDEALRKRYRFHNTRLADNIELALHAVAIHEQRKEFDVTPMKSDGEKPVLKQVWFPGDHGCVGGGRWEKRGLSNRCLCWMLDEIQAAGIRLGLDRSRLDDGCESDPSVAFQAEVNLPYSRKQRKIDSTPTNIDSSTWRRYLEHPEEQKGRLKQIFQSMDTPPAPPGVRHPPRAAVRLQPGESADLRVHAARKIQPVGVAVEAGARYTLRVSVFQVWQDGELDPCDIRGWSLDPDKGKLPWKDGKPADLGWLNHRLNRRAASRRLVPRADWFELVAGIGGESFEALDWKRPGGGKALHFEANYRAGTTGELHFAANDLTSRFDIIDKYDNNRGFVWVQVSRDV